MKKHATYEDGEPVIEVMPESLIDPDELSAEDRLIAEIAERPDIDWRMVPAEIVRWCLSGTPEGSFTRLLVCGLFLCPEEWGYPSQRALAAHYKVLPASINARVREFEEKFGLSLPNRKSDEARLKYAHIVRNRAAITRANKPIKHLCNKQK